MENINISVNASDLATVVLFEGYSEKLLNFATACCVIYMCIGLPGNLITIIALAKYEKVRNATATFIINLSIADLSFTIFVLPFATSTVYHRSWIHGATLCRIYPFVKYGLVATSLLSVLAITVNRYVLVAHQRLYPKLYQKRNIALMIACIWIFSFGVLIPTSLGKYGKFGLDAEIGSCSILFDEYGRSPKKILFVIAFGLPCLAIIVCYARIFFIVRKTTKKCLKQNKINKDDESSTGDSTTVSVRLKGGEQQALSDNGVTELESVESTPKLVRTVTIKVDTRNIRKSDVDNKLEPELRRTALRKSMALLKLSLPTRKDRRLGTMILAVMVAFCICHLPITIIKLLREINPNPAANITAYILLYMSSSVNPIIYVLLSKEYRKAYRNLYKRQTKGNFSIRKRPVY